MRCIIIALAATLLLTGCFEQNISDAKDAAEHLDGMLVRDKDGCVYTVTREAQNAVVMLRVVPELSPTESCTFATAYLKSKG